MKFGLRQIVRYRAFTIMAVSTLALGIGANTAIFTLIDSIMLKPLPFPQQEQLVRISGYFPKEGFGNCRIIRNRLHPSRATGRMRSRMLRARARRSVFLGSAVTVNTLDTLRIPPVLGSFFSQENAVAGRDFVVVLNYGYWQQHFGSDPRVIGQTHSHRWRVAEDSWRAAGGNPLSYADTQFVIPVAFKGGNPVDTWGGVPFNYRALDDSRMESRRRQRKRSCEDCIRCCCRSFRG